MGFRHFILVGFDSCLGPAGNKRFDSDKFVGITREVYVGEGEHRKGPFIGNMAMLAQAREFQVATYGVLPNMHCEVWGNGLIAAIIEDRKQRGMRA